MTHPRHYTAKTIFGARFACDLNDIIQRYIFYFGIWEPSVSSVLRECLVEGDVFVDVGANIGYDSLLASSCVGNSGKVIAIEASPTIYQLLTGNIARNSVSNIRAVNVAASDRRGVLTIYLGGKDNIGRTTTIGARGYAPECQVDALPVTEILKKEEFSRVKAIKIDVEGAELRVLANLSNNLAAFPDDLSIIVEASVEDKREEWEDILLLFNNAGFVAYEIENNYDLLAYLRSIKPSKIRLMEKLPNTQTDILLTRRSVSPALVA